MNILDALLSGHPNPSHGFLFGRMPDRNSGDIWEKDDTTYIELEIPGVKAENVDMSAHDGILKITWKRLVRGSEEKCYRNYQISKEINIDSIKAKVENGILTVEMKRNVPEVRKILVSGQNVNMMNAKTSDT